METKEIKIVKERPIIFSASMVRAILAGRKAQTRRLKGLESINERPNAFRFDGQNIYDDFLFYDVHGAITGHEPPDNIKLVKCPYGKVGDLLWVKETFFAFGYWIDDGKDGREFVDRTLRDAARYGFSTDDVRLDELYSYKDRFSPVIGWWKRPSIFMPKVASRINLEITNIRVERLQEISRADAAAEGVCIDDPAERFEGYRDANFPEENFEVLWDKINGKRAPWISNPWLWVIEFKKVS